MQTQQGIASSSSARIEALKAKHRKISKQIEREQIHYGKSDEMVLRWKREKLKLKEEIEGIRAVS